MTDAHRNEARAVLAIEASNPSSGPGGVCVARVHGARNVDVLGSYALDGGARSSDGIVGAIDRACDAAGVVASDIDAIAVSVGPGGYTALRIATTTAKVLAHAIGCDLIPVPTPHVAAGSVGPFDRPALIALAGKKDSAHLTVLGADGSIEPIGVARADAIKEGLAGVLVGDGHVPDAIAERCAGLGMRRVPIVLTAEACLRASLDLPGVPADALEPEYAREPDAVTQWRARHGG